jgi:hypothetical protein
LAAGDWGGEQVLTVVLLRGINNIIHEKSRGVFKSEIKSKSYFVIST